MLVILDGNCCVFPTTKDNTSGLRSYTPFALPPLAATGVGVHPVKAGSSSSKKNRVVLTILAFQVCKILSILC